jgi:hypothetical protein
MTFLAHRISIRSHVDKIVTSTAPTNSLSAKDRLVLASRDAATDMSNFHLLHYRRIDGFLVTAKNSGTHWLKYMLSHALADQLGLPPPLHASGRTANDFVGHPKWPRKHAQAPRIGSSHNLPSSILACRPIFRTLRLPPIVVLVRDIQQAMLSHHVKWREESGLSLSDYVRVRPPGRRQVADIWWYINFFNRWGRMAARFPDKILVVRYEDMRHDQKYWLEKIQRHYNLALSPRSIEVGVAASCREEMREKLDPNAGELIIPADHDRRIACFSPEDEAHLRALLAENLKFSFGYDYGAARDLAADATAVEYAEPKLS